jgi:predicted transcriptional regulator
MDFFNHEDLKKSNPDFVDITLRVRVKAEIESGKLKDIGVLHNGKGRPKNVYSLAVNNDIIEKMKQAGIILHSQYLTQKITDINSTANSKSQVEMEEQVAKVKASMTLP